LGDALLRRWVGQQLKRRLDGLKIFSCEQDDVVFAVLGDVDSLVGTADFVGNLREPGFHLRQGQHCHRPEL
jgi:hypothetical protein